MKKVIIMTIAGVFLFIIFMREVLWADQGQLPDFSGGPLLLVAISIILCVSGPLCIYASRPEKSELQKKRDAVRKLQLEQEDPVVPEWYPHYPPDRLDI